MPAGIGILQVKPRVSKEQQSETSRVNSRGSGGADTSDRVTSEQVFVDPLTKEEISKTFDIDEKGRKKYDSFGQPVYIERDKWFRIKAKFLWKDAPLLQGLAGAVSAQSVSPQSVEHGE
jgi:hypothetical protein